MKHGLLCLLLLVVAWKNEVACATTLYYTNQTEPTPHEVPATRIQRLAKGINLAHWFAQGKPTVDYIQNRGLDSIDFKLLRTAGFTYVRLSFDPELIFNADNPSLLNPELLVLLEKAVDNLIAADLAVVLDFHPATYYKNRLMHSELFAEKALESWYTLSDFFNTRSPEMLFFEVLNEPAFENPQDWYRLQMRFVSAIRSGVPVHTIIISANMCVSHDDWNGVKALTLMPILQDHNIIYNFHFYEPYFFTHQGASWGWEMLQCLKYLPYPSSLEAVKAALKEPQEKIVTDIIRYYGYERWNLDKLKARLQPAADWARANQVPVTCNEFGAYKPNVRVEDRMRYLHDMRTALESFQIGWGMWDYDAGFALVEKVDNQKIITKEMKIALNLK